jgi:catechol-2,3-dioxygenase
MGGSSGKTKKILEMKSHFGFAKLVVNDLDGTAAFYWEVAQLEELMRVEDEVGGRAV